jgi:hypothetical protein
MLQVRRLLTMLVASLPFLFSLPAFSQDWVDLYDPTKVLTLNLDMLSQDWDTIRKDTTNDIEVPAMFWATGEESTKIQVSVRRKSSRALPSEGNPIKVGMKVDINEFVKGQLWHGVAKLSLENGADTDPISEGLAWNVHELASVDGFYGAGYHAGLASWVRVIVNGSYIGLYINVEERDKQFLVNRRTFVKGRTWLYEIDDTGTGAFEFEEGGPNHSPTWQTLNYSPFQVGTKRNPLPPPPDSALKTQLENLIDMRVMLTQGAVDAFSSNNDSLFNHGKNFRHADFDPADPTNPEDPLYGLKRRYYMWDLDAAITNTSANIYAQKTRRGEFAQTEYQRVILNHPEFREQYNNIMKGLLNTSTGPLSETKLHNFLNAVQIAVVGALSSDPYAGFSSSGAVSAHFSSLRGWASQRIANVLQQVDLNAPPPRVP